MTGSNNVPNQPGSTFPSQFVPSTVKNSEEYCQKYSEAFHGEAFNNTSADQPTVRALVRNNKTYTRGRQYGRGEQSMNQYKEYVGLKTKSKNEGGSFRNLNFSILKVGPKIKNVLVNKMVNQPLNMTCKPIDPMSMSKRRTEKNKILEFMINQENIKMFEELSKIGLEKPFQEGDVPPSNINEIDPYLDMYPKDVMSMEVLDFIKKTFEENDWNQLKVEIANDLIECGVGGIIPFLSPTNKIRFERIIPENCISNVCIYPDFRDMIRFGQYFDVTVGDLRRESRGKLKEEDMIKIANSSAGNSSKYNPAQRNYNENTYTYAYDHEKVKTLKIMWLSTDSEVHVEYYNEAGNRRIKQMPHDYVPYKGDATVNDGKGMTDEKYNEINKGKKRIYRTDVRNVYQATWVVGTKYVYNCGLMKNMLRENGNWQETRLPVVLMTTDFVSTMSIMENPLDQVQLNYLQYQSHSSASKPPGIAIEKNALARVGIKGQGGKKWDPKEDLIMYAETGNLLYDGYDKNENPLQQAPFTELAGGLPAGAAQHFQEMLNWISMIRQMVGLNDLTEGQTPPERLGKSVAEMSFGASDNALSHLTKAYRDIYVKTARNVFAMLQNNILKMDSEELSESLGLESFKHFSLNSDLGLIDMGISLDEGPNEIVKQRITDTLNRMVDAGQLPGETAVMIQMNDNPYRQVQMIKKARIEYQNQQAAIAQKNTLVQTQAQSQSAVELEQVKQQTMQTEHALKMQELQFQAAVEKQARDDNNRTQIIVESLKLNASATENEQKLVNEYVMSVMNNAHELEKEKISSRKKATT